VPSILLKYLLKRWTLPLLGALLFYGGLLMANEVVGVSKEIFTAGAPFRWVIPMLLLSVPYNLAIVLPMASVLGGVLGTQYLVEGSELVAAQGLGVGMRVLIKPWLLLSALLLVLATANSHILVPWANTTQGRVQTQMFEEARTRFLRPGAPPWFPPSRPRAAVWMAPDGHLHLMEVSPDSAEHLVSKSLAWNQSDQGIEVSNINLQMNDLKGASYGKADGSVRLMQEKEHAYAIAVPPVPRLLASSEARFQSTAQLFRDGRPEALVELSRRLTLPLASCALLLLGIGLGLGHPRFQKGGAILKSLAVILIYYLFMKSLENQVLFGKAQLLLPRIGIFVLPLLFLAAGILLVLRKLHPHQSNRYDDLPPVLALRRGLRFILNRSRLVALVLLVWGGISALLRRFRQRPGHQSSNRGLLAVWTRDLWWRNWGAVMGTFLALSILIEYAGLAGDLAHNHVSSLVFLRYWLWNLPPFLAVVVPLAFLLGGVLAMSDAAITREWVALRAGGVSFLQWCRAGFGGWGLVLLFTFLLQAFLAPAAFQRADPLYQQILGRPPKQLKTMPWLNLAPTGVIWFLDGNVRWGFPLKGAGEAPILLRWEMGSEHSQALAWDALAMVPGPPAQTLFPDRALRDSASAETTPTLDLFHWQKFAPDPARATMLWGRLLNWLAGPCLLFAMLPFAFPSPRGGRGQALGLSLVAGLIFMGMQTLFSGAAKAGEFPSLWGVLSPMVLMLGFGLLQLRKLRT
jgi:lipopolysaccharide export LptBFGC system permease protein LptF